jgi:hypothetical protein
LFSLALYNGTQFFVNQSKEQYMKLTKMIAMLFCFTAAVNAGDSKTIQTRDDFTAFLKTKNAVAVKIVSKCSPQEIKAVTDSLGFNDGKLVRMSTKELTGKLTEQDFAKLLSAFGRDARDCCLQHDWIVNRCYLSPETMCCGGCR